MLHSVQCFALLRSVLVLSVSRVPVQGPRTRLAELINDTGYLAGEEKEMQRCRTHQQQIFFLDLSIAQNVQKN